MRAYLAIDWAQLAELQAAGSLPGPLRACAVDPAWRAGDPDVDEEEWEFEAQSLAAQSLAAESLAAGVVLAVDVDPVPDAAQDDGWFVLPGPVRRRDVAAVLTADLAWFAAQEIPALLGAR